MAIIKLDNVTYNDFQVRQIIDPNKFDTNFQDCVDKIDEIVDKVNDIDDTYVTKDEFAAIADVQTTSFTLSLSNSGKLQLCTNTSDITVTVPTEVAVEFTLGTELAIVQYGTGQVTVVASSGVTINSVAGTRTLSAQYATASLKKIASDEWLLVGNLQPTAV